MDPVAVEVIRHGFESVTDEMNASLIRTSHSPNIKDRKDCSCALFDSGGRLVSQAENIPVHLGSMPFSVESALNSFSADTWESGDAVIMNDPFRGGAHLPDVTLISPVFHRNAPVGFVANRAHHSDIGGVSAGSVSGDASEIYEEGLRIPPVHLMKSGELCSDVMEMILANVRVPSERRGDIRAQIAANNTGVERLNSLIDRHGFDSVNSAFDDVIRNSERRTREEITEIDPGVYHASDVLDDDGAGGDEVDIKVELEVRGDELVFDFSGSAEAVNGSVNAVLSVTASAVYYVVRCVTNPDIPTNQGCYKPIDVRAPSGSVLNAEPPSAVVGGNLEVSQRVVDVVIQVISEAAPDRTLAGSQGTMNSLTFGGGNNGDGFAFYETIGGGMGAHQMGDGLDGVHVHMSNTRNTPAEVIETVYPLRLERYELRRDSGGDGRCRGGLGIKREIRCRCDGVEFSVLADRRRNAPRGINSGLDGATGRDSLLRDGEAKRIPSKSSHILEKGDVVRIETPGGGGFGDPLDRSRKQVLRDLENGYISMETAEEIYEVDVEE